MREVIATEKPHRPSAPIRRPSAPTASSLSAGRFRVNPATQQIVEGGVAEQTEQVLTNLEAILKAAGSGLDKVVRTGVFLKDMSEFAAMNDVYERFFPQNPPARSTVEVARLPKDVRVEIDAIALAG